MITKKTIINKIIEKRTKNKTKKHITAYANNFNEEKKRSLIFLLANGLNINTKDNKNRTILYKSIRLYNIDLLKFLLINNADSNIIYEKPLICKNLLAYCCKNKRTEFINIFLKYAKDLNPKLTDFYNKNAIYYAFKNKDNELLNKLNELNNIKYTFNNKGQGNLFNLLT